jgi:peptidoglycan-associated lipoprotein
MTQLLKYVRFLLVSGAMLTMVACSAPGNGSKGNVAVSDADGAQSSGLGGDSSFGDDSNAPRSLLGKRTYYFDFDRYDVRDSDKSAIFANADYLVSHPNARIILEGHTDPRGSREYNVALGEHRADSVLELLKSKGVNPDQIRMVSYGAERLAVPGHSEEDYQMDRRVVIVYSKS